MAMAAFLSGDTPKVSPSYAITDSGNSTMKVVVRLRPETEAEVASSYQSVVKPLDDFVLVFDPLPDNAPTFNKPTPFKRKAFLSKKHKDLQFAFDKVFDETASQVDVFENTTKAIIDGVLDGMNCSVFAYGATGAGKTYTMLGNLENPGVMFLTMMELYRRIDAVKSEKTCEVAVTYCEVYNETIRDLLVPSGYLHLRDDGQNELVVSGLSRHQPHSADELLNLLEIGNRNRTQHPTDANATSSRSHAVFQVLIHQKARTAGLSAEMTVAKMSLIDLAGSERATVTTNRGARLREGANINKSLLALGNCINALADVKAKPVQHVPYRNSKLTRLLKDSLGGNCRTVMIANISPSGLSFEDTYNTLKYADRAKQIKTKLVRNVLNVDFHVSKYRAIVQDLQKEISELKQRLEKRSPKKVLLEHSDSARLQESIQAVYGERTRLRKRMAELDATEREVLLRVCRKERDVVRIETLSRNQSRQNKLMARVESLRGHVTGVRRQKQQLNEQLCANNELIGGVQSDINTACSTGGGGGGCGPRQLLEVVTESRRLETETAHQWKQTKYLLKFIKNQEREMSKTERILVCALELVRKQHAMLRGCSLLTSGLQDQFDGLVHMTEGEKEVAWADQKNQSSDTTLLDVSTSSFSQSQLALFDSFVFHSSPLRRGHELRENSPLIASSLGILANASVGENPASSQVQNGGGQAIVKTPSMSFGGNKNQSLIQSHQQHQQQQATKNSSSTLKSAENKTKTAPTKSSTLPPAMNSDGEKATTVRLTTKRTNISHPLAKAKSIADVIVPPSSPQNFHANPISSGRFRKVNTSSQLVAKVKGESSSSSSSKPQQFSRPVSFQSSCSTYNTRLNTVLNSQGSSHSKSSTLPRANVSSKIPNASFKPHPPATPTNAFEDNFVSPRNPKTVDRVASPNNFNRPPMPNCRAPSSKLSPPPPPHTPETNSGSKHNSQMKSTPEVVSLQLQEKESRELSPLERASIHYHRLHTHLTQHSPSVSSSPSVVVRPGSNDSRQVIAGNGSYPLPPPSSTGAAFQHKEPIKPATPLAAGGKHPGNVLSARSMARGGGGGGGILNRSYARSNFIPPEFATPSRSFDHSLLSRQDPVPSSSSSPMLTAGGGGSDRDQRDNSEQLGKKKGGILNTPSSAHGSFDHAALFDALMSSAPPTSTQKKRQLRIATGVRGGILNSPVVSLPPRPSSSQHDFHHSSPTLFARPKPPPPPAYHHPAFSSRGGAAPVLENGRTSPSISQPSYKVSSFRPFDGSKPLAMVSPALNLAPKFDKEATDSKLSNVKFGSSQQVVLKSNGGTIRGSDTTDPTSSKQQADKETGKNRDQTTTVKPAFPTFVNVNALSSSSSTHPPNTSTSESTLAYTSDSAPRDPTGSSVAVAALKTVGGDSNSEASKPHSKDGIASSFKRTGAVSLDSETKRVQSLDLSSLTNPRLVETSKQAASASLDQGHSVQSCDLTAVSCDPAEKSCDDGNDVSLNSTFTVKCDFASATGDGSKKIPSYLQMTKSAASKRVMRLQNKENKHFSTAVPSNRPALKSKKLQSTRSFLSKSATELTTLKTSSSSSSQAAAGQRATFLNKPPPSRAKSFLVH